jgi:hypothetical protein
MSKTLSLPGSTATSNATVDIERKRSRSSPKEKGSSEETLNVSRLENDGAAQKSSPCAGRRFSPF